MPADKIINIPTDFTDGTIVTAENLGIHDVSGVATYETDENGISYISCATATANNPQFDFVSSAYITSAEHFSYEIGLCLTTTGAAWPADDQHRIFVVSSGGTRLLGVMRSLDADANNPDRIQYETTEFITPSGDRTEIEYQGGTKFLTYDNTFRLGVVVENTTNGFCAGTINGMPISFQDGVSGGSDYGVNFATVANMGGVGKFLPIDSDTPHIKTKIYGPIKIWNTDPSVDHIPDYSSLAAPTLWRPQLSDRFGPWSVSGTAKGVWGDYPGSGIKANRFRNEISGSAGQERIFELKAEHAFGVLPSHKGRACFQFPGINLPDGASNKTELGTTEDGDILTVLFDGSSGTAGARPIKINGIETGITYDESVRYTCTLIFDDNGDSVIFLHDLTNTISQRTMWSEYFDYKGIPEVNKVKTTITRGLSDGAEFEPPKVAPQLDLVLVSSYVSTTNETITPNMVVPNRLSINFDHAVVPANTSRVVLETWAPAGRSGRSIVDLPVATDNYSVFKKLKHQRLAFLEFQVNDSAVVSVVKKEMKAILSMCYNYDIECMAVTQIPRPAGGSSNISDAYRNQQLELNEFIKTEIKKLSQEKDLFYLAEVYESYPDLDSATNAVYNAGNDDVHYEPGPNAGEDMYGNRARELMARVGKEQSQGVMWGKTADPKDIPKFIPQHLRSSAVLTDRGWEVPLAGSLTGTEVVVAGNYKGSTANDQLPAIRPNAPTNFSGISGSEIHPVDIEVFDRNIAFTGDVVAVGHSSGIPSGLEVVYVGANETSHSFKLTGTPLTSGTGSMLIRFCDNNGDGYCVDHTMTYFIGE